MIENEQQPEKSLAADIFGVTEYAPELPTKKEFLPWHKPRKQFVREKQWLHQIRLMLEDAPLEGDVIKYLGLPGDDLLDLRYFHQEVCVPNNVKLKYIGFNYGANPMSKRSTELFVSIDEVNKLPNIDPTSTVLGYDICQIANKDSIAHEQSMKYGPYDIINIDLCDGFARQPFDKFIDTHYTALSQLLTLQARKSRPWLLLLTTRTDTDSIDAQVFEKLKLLYCQNLDSCQVFREASTLDLNVSDRLSLDDKCNDGKGASEIFLIALCKWIATNLVAQRPPSSMELKSVIGYKVQHAVNFQDLVSIAIRISPTTQAAPDPLGLAQHDDPPRVDECTLALQAMKRVIRLVDADTVLKENRNDIKGQMIQSASILMEQARYNVDEFHQWANSI